MCNFGLGLGPKGKSCWDRWEETRKMSNGFYELLVLSYGGKTLGCGKTMMRHHVCMNSSH